MSDIYDWRYIGCRIKGMLYVKEYKNLTFRLRNQDHNNIRYSMTKLFSTKNFIF